VSWKTVRLGDVLDISRGGSPRPIEQFITEDANGLNWIKIGDVKEGEKFITKTAQKISNRSPTPPKKLAITRDVRLY
jgi:type I restriction enzyme S subunit